MSISPSCGSPSSTIALGDGGSCARAGRARRARCARRSMTRSGCPTRGPSRSRSTATSARSRASPRTRSLPLIAGSSTRTRRRRSRAPAGPRHVLRLGHPHALRAVARLQPDELPQRLGLAARQRDHRRRPQALRPVDGLLEDRDRTIRCRIAERATSAYPSSTAASTVATPRDRQLPGRLHAPGWAAAAPFMMLQAMLSVTARAPERTLAVIEPVMPPWLGRVELHDLRVGNASVSLAFSQNDGITGFSLLAQQGELTVTMAAPPRSGSPTFNGKAAAAPAPLDPRPSGAGRQSRAGVASGARRPSPPAGVTPPPAR